MPGYERVNSTLNFKVMGVRVNDAIDIINANGGGANRLGLNGKDGLTKNELAGAYHKAKKLYPNRTNIHNGIAGMWRNFGTLDQNGDGRIALGDVPGLVDNEAPWLARQIFGRNELITHGQNLLRNEFGITDH